jgi:hypothetical protein
MAHEESESKRKAPNTSRPSIFFSLIVKGSNDWRIKERSVAGPIHKIKKIYNKTWA